MEYYEELIHYYLTSVKQFPVLPQAAILRNSEEKDWKADVDFVALDFSSQKIYLIEVTSNTNYPCGAVEKLAPQNHMHIENYVRRHLLQDSLSFPIIWWLFVRRRHIPKIKRDPFYVKYCESGGVCEVIAIQKVLAKMRLKLS